MVEKPLVSILINNYNYGHFLGEAVDSALNQSYNPLEIIIVDDGSTDNSREVIATYEQNVKLVLKENGGQASALNRGFSESNGEIICFLDADDIFKPRKIETIVEKFKSYPEADWLFHSLLFFAESNSLNDSEPSPNFSGFYDLRSSMKKGRLDGALPFDLSIATSGMCFKRDFLRRILPMPEAIKITSDDYLKYVTLGKSVGIIELSNLSLQRIHGNNAYTNRTDQGSVKSKTQILTAYYIKKNFPELSSFSNNLLSLGIALYWWNKKTEPEIQEIVLRYLNKISNTEKVWIYIKAIYYRYIYYLFKA
ncbi:glycosyltransferase [Leptolyngbya sp. CCNP1308]|uniref:glycosyltransferase family 2 protein n=1 Tax=Leptolyngbya sp. CCNP1308 TaxID=3110255 RepID=UPI002B20D080|nr:glycosyltransferase [Leptolyngbya sp. CCNP1308]MEA5449342.1 glycosyltransferase [Leptolyngbya sp. CCNP1308]